MSEIQRQAELLADMDRRIRQLEGGQRAGLSSIQMDGVQPEQTLTSYGVNNWSDLGGNAPEVTLSTGRRVIIDVAWRARRVGGLGANVGIDDHKSSSVTVGISIDATPPQGFPSPTMRSQFARSSTSQLNVPMVLRTFRHDLVPGGHTFKLLFYAHLSEPSGTLDPLIDDMSLIITPLGPG